MMHRQIVARKRFRSRRFLTASGLTAAICLVALPPVFMPSGTQLLFAQDRSGKDLPDEGVLPGQRSPADSQQLPTEADLPNQRQPDADVPGEQQLAGGAPGADVQTENESAPIAGNAPILRLDVGGHTGPIRAVDLSDGGRTLVSGGEDKNLHVWRRTDTNQSGWLHRRTVRWPVSRGPRGRIYTATLNGDLVAFAGHGAFGAASEIRVVDVATGDLLHTLFDADRMNEANILALAWSPADQPHLASIDMRGVVMDWKADPQTGIWQGTRRVEDDVLTYGDAIASSLQMYDRRGFVGISFLGENHLVIPRLAKDVQHPQGIVVWHLQRIDLRTGESELLRDQNHLRCVRSIIASEDGRFLATTDMAGKVGVWKFDGEGKKTDFDAIRPPPPEGQDASGLQGFALSLDLDSKAKRLLIGTDATGNPARSVVELWDLSKDPPAVLGRTRLSDHVYGVALDVSRGEAIVSQGNASEIHSFDHSGKFTGEEPKRLQSPARPVRKVAFERADGYRLAFGSQVDQDGNATLEGIFDLAASRLSGEQSVVVDDFRPAQSASPQWRYEMHPVEIKFSLFEGDQKRGDLPLNVYRHGLPTAICTIEKQNESEDRDVDYPDANQAEATDKAAAVVIGTSGGNNIYVYRADASDPPKLLRQFRDHSGTVRSLSVSADGRYLASGADDATIAIWNLQDIFTASEMVNRWGADFEIEGDRLIATAVREDGPLYFRGLRSGDELKSIEYRPASGELVDESEASAIRQALLDVPFDTLVVFKFWRLNRRGPDFQSYPAWRPLATLFVDQNREWAYWTPAGYYDASFNGHQQFGWQLNNANLDRPVQYFRAAQFRKTLERPDIMRQLLSKGSLPAAVRETATQIGPPPAEGAIVNQIESKPEIRLLSPNASQVIDEDQLTVRAEIELPIGATLIPPKAFVSGVPAISRQQVPSRSDASERILTYEWQFRLPSDPLLQLEILAATETEALARLLVNMEHSPPADRPTPRLHVLAIGVSEYRDPQIQSLDFAADAAGTLSSLLRERATGLYETSADQLVNRDGTRPMWRVFAQSAAEQLADTVGPDDLVVMYLCGHGLRDRRTDQWYFVTADARYSDLMNDQYGDCIAFSDLALLSKLPCRKLAILDSCHSGAVQPVMRHGDLKSALRFLQDDVVLTLTASEGDEEAAEKKVRGLGRFTAALVDALNGNAPELNDPQTVSLQEIVQHVVREVSQDSEAAGIPQHPTASPAYLLETLRLPLAKRSVPVKSP